MYILVYLGKCTVSILFRHLMIINRENSFQKLKNILSNVADVMGAVRYKLRTLYTTSHSIECVHCFTYCTNRSYSNSMLLLQWNVISVAGSFSNEFENLHKLLYSQLSK